MGYTGVWNVLDYSAVSFPVGITAHRDVDVSSKDQKPLSDICAAVQDSCRLLDYLGPGPKLTGQ